MIDDVEKDLKLSEKFISKQCKLEREKQRFLREDRKKNSDTVEALLIFQSNTSYYRLKYESKSLIKRPQLILDELQSSFPLLDTKVINKAMLKAGFISDIVIRSFLISLFVLTNILLNYYVFNFQLTIAYFFEALLPILAISYLLFETFYEYIANYHPKGK